MKDLSEARCIVEQQRGEIERLQQEVTMLRQEYAADTVEIAKLNAMIDEQRGEIERLRDKAQIVDLMLAYEIDVHFRVVGIGRIETIAPCCEKQVVMTENPFSVKTLRLAVLLASTEAENKKRRCHVPTNP